ncbi:MAG: efflux RND transporter periplasmic adaptor subunit [Rhodospirillales bacterium]|nr:efflux RND transporter periplasmic adaptor subunit [Rhodospirillales bacterium]
MTKRVQLALCLVAGLGLGACKEELPPEQPIRPVRAIVAEPRQEKHTVSITGEIRSRYESDHGFRIGGRVIARLVDVGSLVAKGDVLARLDDGDQKNQIRGAEAALSAARAEVTRAKPQEDRQRQLLASGFTTQVQYDNALKTLRAAEAAAESAAASLKLAQDQLKYTSLTAEFDGVVTATGAEIGQVVQAGQMVAKVADPKFREAVVNLAEARMRPIPPDFQVDVELLSDPNAKATGKIREISPIADPTTRTFTVKISLDDPPESMRLGSTVSVSGSAQAAPVIKLPPTAVFERDRQPVVWIVDRNAGTVSLKPVKILRNDTDSIVIGEGVKAGDLVVTAGVLKLNEGQKVKLQEAAAK